MLINGCLYHLHHQSHPLFLYLFFLLLLWNLQEIWAALPVTWVRHSSRKSSATHSCQCVEYFPASRQWYGCQHLGLLMCAQIFMQAIAHRGCRVTVRLRESALWEKNRLWETNLLVPQGLEPTSVWRLAFQLYALPPDLFLLLPHPRGYACFVFAFRSLSSVPLGSWKCVQQKLIVSLDWMMQ